MYGCFSNVLIVHFFVFFSIVRKASSVMELLRDVLNSMDPRHPEVSVESFTATSVMLLISISFSI